jgi:hypothetical protein
MFTNRKETTMRKIALIPAVLAAGIAYAAPVHADPVMPSHPILDWVGDSPTGGMVVAPNLPVHAEMHTIDGVMHMTAANGCVETWIPGSAQGDSVINGVFNTHIDIQVDSGEGPGCRSGGITLLSSQDKGGGNWEMTVTQSAVATWILHGHE